MPTQPHSQLEVILYYIGRVIVQLAVVELKMGGEEVHSLFVKWLLGWDSVLAVDLFFFRAKLACGWEWE